MLVTRTLLTGLLYVAVSLGVAASAAAQIVVSHDFEDGSTQGWFSRGGHGLENSMDVARSGIRSLKTTGRTQTWMGPGLDLRTTLAPGATYRISGWVRLVAGEDPTTLIFTAERRPVGESDSTFMQVGNAAATDGDWVQVQGTYSFATPDNQILQVYLESASATAAYYLDDFTIEQLSGPPTGCPEPLDQTGFTSDFEDGTTQGWGPRAGESIENSAAAAHTGLRSLAATTRGASWQGPSRNVLCKMHNGSAYRVSLWARLVDGEPASSLRVSLQRDTGDDATFHTVIGNTPVTDGAWVNLVTESYLVNLQPFGALQLYVETASGTASFYIDDVQVEHIPPVPQPPIQTDIPRLKEVLADYFPMGTAIEPVHTTGRHAELLLHHYNRVTAENAMKVGPLQPTEGNFTFGPADTIADFARANGLKMHGHALLWHSQNPAWLFENLGPDARQTMLNRLEDHINEVVGRYKDVVESWDVVNEVIDENQPGGLRNTPWLQHVGPEYIRRAFEFAHAADPTARLCINDFNTHVPAKREALWNLVQQLLADGVPVDCVGHQMHINYVNPPLDQIRATLERFAADERLVNQVTEFDASIFLNPTDTAPPTEETLIEQGYRYRDVFNLFRELSDSIAVVTFWGLGDAESWLSNGFPIQRPDAPLPFDRELQAKHAYWGIVDPSELPVVPQQLGIAGGTAHIDGKVDLGWELTAPVSMGFEGPLSASFRALWAPGTLYLLVDVMDATKNAGDMVEVFVGGAKHVFQGTGRQKGADATIVTIQGGYRLEAAIPAGAALAPGDVIRADLRVTDASGGGRQLSWSDTSHGQDDDTSGFGFLELMQAVEAATARRGTPTIDAIEENLWKHAQEIATDTFVLGDSGATATARVLWDAGHLYVFAKVTDPLLSDASNNPWEEDSVEIFVDQNNAKTTSYQGDDMQFRVNYNNVQSFGGAASASKFQTATRTVDGGYHVEAAIAMDVPLTAGMVIGFDLQVNDDGMSNGIRTSVKTWNDTSGNAFQDPSQFGVLKLVIAGP